MSTQKEDLEFLSPEWWEWWASPEHQKEFDEQVNNGAYARRWQNNENKKED